MTPLDQLDLKLDTWDVDYGPELPLTQEDPGRVAVDLDVEAKAADWAAVRPAGVPLPARLLFVDGVRRVEARVVSRRSGRIVHGAFGSFGVGAVLAEPGAAGIAAAEPHRVLALDSGESMAQPFAVEPGLGYRVVSAPDNKPDAALRRIQEEMRLAEEGLARRLADAKGDGALVVMDGPLTFGERVRGAAVGYVKRLFELYVEPSLVGVLAKLPAGTRSPLFAIESPARFARYSWFLRLAAPQAADSDLAGLVRLEVAASVGKDAARRLADMTCATLPRFAPSRGRDPRAPQNLLPIGALESHLRRLLGDPRLIRRKIAERLAEAVHA